MFELTFTHLDTEREYNGVYEELFGEKPPANSYDPEWSHSLSAEVTGEELARITFEVATCVPSVELWQMQIKVIEPNKPNKGE